MTQHFQDYMASIQGVEENEHIILHDAELEDDQEEDILSYTICAGNPWDGMFLVGSFETSEDAVNYAEIYHQGEDYYIIPVHDIDKTPSEELE